MAAHHGFYLRLSDDVMLDTFHVFAGHLHVFSGKISLQILCLVFSLIRFVFFFLFCFLILSCMNSLYTLDINLLSDISFANIFSHSVGCFFTLLVISFSVKKLFSLM